MTEFVVDLDDDLVDQLVSLGLAVIDGPDEAHLTDAGNKALAEELDRILKREEP